MADVKISGLPASTTPLAGTEVLPIVQSGATKKVSVENLTAGRLVNVGNFVNAGYSNLNDVVNILNGKLLYLYNPGSTNYWSMSEDSSNNFILKNVNNTVVTGTPAGNVTINFGNLVMGTAAKGIDFSINPNPAGATSELLNDYEEGTFDPTDSSGAGLTFTNRSGFYTKIGRQVNVLIQFQFPVTADASQARIALPFTAINTGATQPGGGVFTVNAAGPAGAQPAVAGNQAYMLISNVSAGVAYSNANVSGVYFRGVVSYIV
jgi:hypothetical protein